MTNYIRKEKNKSSGLSQYSVNIFGMKLVGSEKHKVLKEVEKNIEKNQRSLILTPNPEILLKARKNKKLQDIIKNSDINIADGVGIRLAFNYLGRHLAYKNDLMERLKQVAVLLVHLALIPFTSFSKKHFPLIKGRELFIDLCKKAGQNEWRIYLLGSTDKVLQKTVDRLRKDNNNLAIKFNEGPRLNDDGKPVTKKNENIEREVIKEINEFKPDITFVGFGAPKQELWSSRNFGKLDTKVVMVVGGTFDYISGEAKLPPAFVSFIGLEWLWRVLMQPSRIKRIIDAVVVFPHHLYLQKMSGRLIT